MGMYEEQILEQLDAVDAIVFSSDWLLTQSNLDRFKESLARWERQSNVSQKIINEVKELEEDAQ